MADCLNNEQQINSNLNSDSLTSNLDIGNEVKSEMGSDNLLTSSINLTDEMSSNLGAEEPLGSELDLPMTGNYTGSEGDNIIVTVDNINKVIHASLKPIKFSSVDDFPEVGSERLIYIDASTKTIYGWNSADEAYYKLSSGGSSDVNIPTKLSEFENDGDGINPFITRAVNDLINYYTKEEVNNLVDVIPKFDIKVVDSLPSENISTTSIYIMRDYEDGSHGNLYTEYIYVDNNWELIGSQKLDLSDYVEREYFNNYTSNRWAMASYDGGFKAGTKSASAEYASDDVYHGGAIGDGARASNGGAIGNQASTMEGGAVGNGAKSGYGFAGGKGAVSAVAGIEDCIQLGQGRNLKDKTLQVYDDNIYDANTHTLTVKNIELDGEDIKDKMNGSVVDADLSETSENPVQNKVITAELSDRVKKSDIDTALSTTSENPVQNKVITNAVNTNMLGVPSNTGWINVSITSASFDYKAPANGYLVWVGNTTTSTGMAKLLNFGNGTQTLRTNIIYGASVTDHRVAGDALSVSVPCKKGDNIYVYLDNTGNENLRFIPAEEV